MYDEHVERLYFGTKSEDKVLIALDNAIIYYSSNNAQHLIDAFRELYSEGGNPFIIDLRKIKVFAGQLFRIPLEYNRGKIVTLPVISVFAYVAVNYDLANRDYKERERLLLILRYMAYQAQEEAARERKRRKRFLARQWKAEAEKATAGGSRRRGNLSIRLKTKVRSVSSSSRLTN